MNDFDMIMKTSRFYEKEAERLLKKLDRSSTKKQKLDALAELKSLKQKIKFEINQISKIIQENEDYYHKDYLLFKNNNDWKNSNFWK